MALSLSLLRDTHSAARTLRSSPASQRSRNPRHRTATPLHRPSDSQRPGSPPDQRREAAGCRRRRARGGPASSPRRGSRRLPTFRKGRGSGKPGFASPPPAGVDTGRSGLGRGRSSSVEGGAVYAPRSEPREPPDGPPDGTAPRRGGGPGPAEETTAVSPSPQRGPVPTCSAGRAARPPPPLTCPRRPPAPAGGRARPARGGTGQGGGAARGLCPGGGGRPGDGSAAAPSSPPVPGPLCPRVPPPPSFGLVWLCIVECTPPNTRISSAGFAAWGAHSAFATFTLPYFCHFILGQPARHCSLCRISTPLLLSTVLTVVKATTSYSF